MKLLDTSAWRTLALLSILTILVGSWSYVSVFHTYLVNDEWEDILGMTRVVIPDTFLYAAIVDPNDIYTSIIVSGVKNALGPSLLWYLVGFDWYIMSLLNALFIYLIILYFEKLARIYHLSKAASRWSVLLLVFLPATLYYSVGALKELPMILLLLMTVYYYVSKSYAHAITAALLLVLFRYQLIVILTFVALLGAFRRDVSRRALVGVLLVAAIYPALTDLQIISQAATESYRELYGNEKSAGAMVENIRDNVYAASLVAVIFRTVQSFSDPIITFVVRGSFYEGDSVSVFGVVEFFHQSRNCPVRRNIPGQTPAYLASR